MNDEFLREIQCDFIREAGELLDKSETLFMSLEKSDTNKTEIFDSLKRLAHNFKGSGKAVGFDELSKFCHTFENLLVALSSGQVQLNPEIIDLLLLINDTLKSDLSNLMRDANTDCKHPEILDLLEKAQHQAVAPAKNQKQNNKPEASPQRVTKDDLVAKPRDPEPRELKPPTDDFIRIPLFKIDELLNSFGEQVIFLSALDFYKNDMVKYKDEITQSISTLKKMSFDLQQSTLNLRMVNLKNLFTKLERVVRDSAKATSKQVICIIEGGEQELDKAILDQLSDPLVHMIRNAVDHGIEDVTDRINSGKSIEGRVTLRARSDGGAFTIEIEDDGKGMDPAKIRKKAMDVGLISLDTKLTDKESFDLIFQNGFSTKEQVSEISGRGVGMNVVKEMILALKGTYEIESLIGKGTIFRIKLPVSLSLFNGLVVRVGEQKFIVPSAQVSEIIDLRDAQIREVSPSEKMVQVRNEVFNLYELAPLLSGKKSRPGISTQLKKAESAKQLIMITAVENRKYGFLISEIINIQRVVQKKLSDELKVCDGAVGVSILGDGSPAIILDIRSLSVISKQTRIKGDCREFKRAA